MKLRLRPHHNLGCVGLYATHWAIDCFWRPYLGIFVRVHRWRTTLSLKHAIPLLISLACLLGLMLRVRG